MLPRLCLNSAFLTILLCFGLNLHAQDGKLSGKVTTADGEPVTYGTVLVFQGDLFRYGGKTDDKGFYSIQPVQAGTYRVQVKYLGASQTMEGVTVNANSTKNLDIQFVGSTDTELDTVVIVVERPFEGNDPTVGTVTNQEQINAQATRDIATVAALSPGVYQADQGDQGLSIRGQRSSATVTYIDGVKVRGQSALPQSAIAQLQVILGGTPAEFGDFTGGVISITTSNPAPKFSGNLELVTSEYLDAFGRNLAGLAVTGPLITKKVNKGTESEYKTSVLGFFLNGELDYNRDRDPAALGVFKLQDDVLADLEQTPVQISEDGQSFRSRANFVSLDQIEPIQAKQNNESLRARALVRLDFQPADNVLIKAGGNIEYIKNDQWGIGSMLFAPDNKSEFEGAYYRAFLRFQQSFKGGENSAVRNFFYSIQGDYSLYERNFQHSVHRDNFFDYGFVGSFTYDETPFYGYTTTPDEISSSPYWRTLGYGFTNLAFDGTDTRNQVFANHNQAMFDYVNANGGPNLRDLNEFAFRQGILNGSGSRSVYSLFSGLGAESASYQKFAFEQFRLSGQATAEIKGHNLKAGFEFEQRVERSYFLATRSLWGWMRQYANFHLLNLEDDPALFDYVTRDGEWQDTVNIPRRYEASDQKNFDVKLREKLGLPVDGTEWVNIDQYGPDTYSLDMFSADELLADGLGPVSYYGYDYLGNRQDPVDPAAFFTDENRPQNAFSPTYISAFLQDRFEFEDIVFNIGVRVDRFDANQLVLKDNFSLYPTFTASEVASGNLGIPSYTLPSGIGEGYVPYVNDANNPTDVVGYRNGEAWFDATGAPVSSNVIAGISGGRVQPAVKNDEVSVESFEDYAPQTVVMPRISFSFPITDVASFFAHYDVLSQRPGQLFQTQSSLLAGRISDYVFLENRPTSTIINPNLRPEITIDYEAGFKQRLGGNMALTISAYYRELRNQIRFRRFANAYPFSYDTYDNLDFGTVKGFSFAYNMRRTRNVALQASYTLQFADATGSDFSSARAVVNFLEGVGVLRVPLPINNDQRHRFTANVDYRFSGARPQSWGPKMTIGGKDIYPLRDFGINLTGYIGSGTPFTKNAVAVPSVTSGVNIVNQTEGTPNGVRKPWQFRIDGRIDKTFAFGGNVKTNGEGKEFRSRAYGLNVYLTVFNVFDTRNVINVYRFTGLADDDGFLSSDTGRQTTVSQIDPQAYVDLYTLRVANPSNFSVPRRIQLGLMFNF
ncbi:MAG: carboxypeptidase regulatory-like domain-containing protein [Bacteroidota bacterium]